MKRRILAALLLAPVVYALMRAAAVDRVHRYETLDADAADLPGMRLYIRGRRMHLTIDGQGPPLLMLHGFGSSSAAFRTLVPHLRSAVTMIAPDLPGWGYSERAPDADHSPKAHATLMIELLDRLSIGRAVVLGYGTGAVIAVHMANTKPDRIAALLLSREEGHDRLLPSWLRPLLTLCVPFLLESRWGQRRLDRSVTALGNRPDEVLVAAHLDEARTVGHTATFLAILTRSRPEPTPATRSIQVPTLTIVDDEQPDAAAISILDFLRAAHVLPPTQATSNMLAFHEQTRAIKP